MGAAPFDVMICGVRVVKSGTDRMHSVEARLLRDLVDAHPDEDGAFHSRAYSRAGAQKRVCLVRSPTGGVRTFIEKKCGDVWRMHTAVQPIAYVNL
jgi:hypothetical protein